MFRIPHYADYHGVGFRPLRAHHMVAQGDLRVAIEVSRKRFVDDRHFGRRRAIGWRKITPGDEGNTQSLQVVIAYPGELDVIFSSGFTRGRTSHTAVAVVVGKIGIVGGTHASHAGQRRERFDHTLFHGRNLAGG